MKTHIISILTFLTLLLSLISTTQAQQDSQYTQYMYNTISINPAYAGNRETLNALAVYRNQWVGLDGAPETLNFSVNSPIGISGVGLGLGFISDKIGPSSENTITADFSYTIPFNNYGTRLSFGIKGGLNSFDLDVNKLNIYDPNDVNLVNRSLISPVVGAGIYLYDYKWYVGLSTPNMLETEHYDDIAVSTATEKMHIYLTAGYVFDMNSYIKFKPVFMMKAVSGSPLAIDLSGNFLLYERMTMGVAYRWDSTVSALLGFQVNENIMIGYSYDYDTTELGNYNHGSHEVFIRFELGTRVSNKVNPRFF